MDYTICTIAPIVLLPFFAFVINAFLAKKFPKTSVGISVAAIVASFFFALNIFSDFVGTKYASNYHIHKVFEWFNLDTVSSQFKVMMGIYIDNMTAVMLLMVTAVASLIHIFSTFYMREDKGFARFFVYLSLFTSAMLGLVLSDNLLSVFIFWEIMGFCSYSLVGFYNDKEGAGNASIKAFMTTRVGDVFFLIGLVAIWSIIGSVSFVDIYNGIADGKFSNTFILGIPAATFIGFSVFMGTIGKSAQFPLQVWLPDAMWGPTPCSALIHAATMVAAGVYLSLRMYPMMELGHLTTFIAYIGAITAFGAATIALVQKDIKAVLAYSTVSQLGYMVIGIGVGAYNASFMHLITHAVFKACLFLGAGSVIHSLHDHHTHTHVQDMDRMGGLRKKLPFTFIAMLFSTLAIAGVPFFSGFVSKDRILGDALVGALHNPVLWPVAILGFVTALLTAFYMFRMIFMTFFGAPKDKDLNDHMHSEHLSWNQNVPLLILACFTFGFVFSGSLTGQGEVKVFGEKYEWFSTLVEKPQVDKFKNYQRQELASKDTKSTLTFEKSTYDENHGLSEEAAHHVHFTHKIGAVVSVIVAVLGITIAFLMYVSGSFSPNIFVERFRGWYALLKNKYGFDDFYNNFVLDTVVHPFNRALGKFDMNIFDKFAVDTWFSISFMNVALRTLQSGRIQHYIIISILVLAGYVWTLV